MSKPKDKVQITIDVSDSPELRKAFWLAADELEVRRSWLGRAFITLGLWIKSQSQLSLGESFEASKLHKRYYPLISILAAAIQLEQLGFPKARELAKLAEEVGDFLESRRETKK